jgi:hypothetical protein
MACLEYLRLRQDYEASLRHWAQAMLSQAEEEGVTASELRLKAYQNRSAAKGKLGLHKESCPTCKGENWRIAGRPKHR